MRITFVTRKFGNVERNSHCDVLHITPVRVARLFLDCNGVFAIKAYYIRFPNTVSCGAYNYGPLMLGQDDNIYINVFVGYKAVSRSFQVAL